jgi:Terminase large subunit, T4likevirus-type, N-terminal
MAAPTTEALAEGLVQACDDVRLFAFDLWPRQRDLLTAVERGPRLQVWALGRRSGKTTMAALTMLWDALLRPELDDRVRPGERRYAVGIATNLRQARLLIRAAATIVHRSPLLSSLVEAETEDEILFRNGTAVTAFPCTSRGGRGWPISCLVCDEFAHFVDTDGNSAAESVWRALVPSTAQFGDEARIIVSSTPYGSDGLFASLYQQASGGELADGQAHHATTAEANPTIPADFFAAEEARDPESFKSEYLAQFVGGGQSFLDPERITEAVTLAGELPPPQNRAVAERLRLVAGLDPAFSSDPFGLVVIGREPTDRSRLCLALARAWKPSRRKPSSFEERREVEDSVLAEVAETCLLYRVRRVVTDQYAAPAIVDALRRKGLSVKTVPMTATTKTAAFLELRARLNARTLDLYEHGDLLAELRRLRSRFSAGSASVVNPRVGGSHGDLAQALALAIYEADRHGLGTSGPESVGFGSADHLPPTWLPDEERRIFAGMDYTPIPYNHPL